jgi:hypothetical protein
MTEDVRTAFEAHDAFEYDPEGGVATGTATVFEATAQASPGEGGATFTVTVVVPTLPAAVVGEVGDAVAAGWYETFELRMEDAYDVTEVADGDLTVEREASTVRVTYEYVAPARPGVNDGAALIDFVEGTHVQGTIPGYDYVPPVADVLAVARRRGQGDAVDRSPRSEPRDDSG